MSRKRIPFFNSQLMQECSEVRIKSLRHVCHTDLGNIIGLKVREIQRIKKQLQNSPQNTKINDEKLIF